MRFSAAAARLVVAMAAGQLAASPLFAVASTSPGATIIIPICGDPGHVISLPIKGGRPAPGSDCPSGCHAMCARRLAEDDDRSA